MEEIIFNKSKDFKFIKIISLSSSCYFPVNSPIKHHLTAIVED